jgi:hypothetical protein
LLLRLSIALERLQRGHAHNRRVVTWELVAAQQLAHFELDQVKQFLVVHHVHLVERDDDRGHVDLAGQQHVLACLRHRAVRRRHHQDRAVDLRCPRDHVLDVVGVTWHVDMCVVAVGSLVLDMGDVDRDTALLFLRCLVDLLKGHVGVVLGISRSQDLRDRRGKGGLAVVDVPHRPYVEVGLSALELLLGHENAPCADLASVRRRSSRW